MEKGGRNRLHGVSLSQRALGVALFREAGHGRNEKAFCRETTANRRQSTVLFPFPVESRETRELHPALAQWREYFRALPSPPDKAGQIASLGSLTASIMAFEFPPPRPWRWLGTASCRESAAPGFARGPLTGARQVPSAGSVPWSHRLGFEA
jgi:hypothetical protein